MPCAQWRCVCPSAGNARRTCELRNACDGPQYKLADRLRYRWYSYRRAETSFMSRACPAGGVSLDVPWPTALLRLCASFLGEQRHRARVQCYMLHGITHESEELVRWSCPTRCTVLGLDCCLPPAARNLRWPWNVSRTAVRRSDWHKTPSRSLVHEMAGFGRGGTLAFLRYMHVRMRKTCGMAYCGDTIKVEQIYSLN